MAYAKTYQLAILMWLEHQTGGDKIFYTTGRLTSEMIMKSTNMDTPVLLSRSVVTNMGSKLARDLCIVMIARAKGKAFLVYNGEDQIEFDATPQNTAFKMTVNDT